MRSFLNNTSSGVPSGECASSKDFEFQDSIIITSNNLIKNRDMNSKYKTDTNYDYYPDLFEKVGTLGERVDNINKEVSKIANLIERLILIEANVKIIEEVKEETKFIKNKIGDYDGIKMKIDILQKCMDKKDVEISNKKICCITIIAAILGGIVSSICPNVIEYFSNIFFIK